QLKVESHRSQVSRDALGQVISFADDAEDFEIPRGAPLSLTIDASIQTILDHELEAGRRNANARSAMAVMLDARSGEVLAISQAPLFDLNQDSIPDVKALKNIIVETVYEPGSTFKPLIAAAAIDEGLLSPSDLVNCEGGRFQVGRHTIKDVHPNDTISLRDVIIRSSNIGMTKVGMTLGAKRLYGAIKKFGFGESSGLGLPGESRGILRNVSTWAEVDVATHSFGQGIAVTPLQMVRAVSAIANGGYLPSLHVVQGASLPPPNRILSARTAEIARDIMYGVVEDEHGTGKKASIEGIRVGGKTGTAQKARAQGRGYADGKYMASFVGFADGRAVGVDRVLSMIVVIDEPHTTSIYGGTLAAPVFKRVMQRTLATLSREKRLGTTLERLPADKIGNNRDSGVIRASYVRR
ncbi:MAG: penicillin-binding protein 2, partial [Bdellovibrionales bacterium]|nr:penicillin-binding protein 2 [Bdellovibrionales bacterium]